MSATLAKTQKVTFSTTGKVTVSALMIALGILLPQLVHLAAGKALGSVLLPMHLPVLMCGFLLGFPWAFAVAVIAPLLSFVVTGMPAPPTLWLMLFELAGYAAASALVYGKTGKIYLSLVSALVFGRLVNAAVLFVGGSLFGISLPPVMYAWTALITGLPGIAFQLLAVPLLVKAIERAWKKFG